MNTKPPAFLRPLALLAVVSLIILALAGRGQAESGAATDYNIHMPIITYPKPLQIGLEKVVTIPGDPAMQEPAITDIASVGKGDPRLFVVLRHGVVRILYPDGRLEPTPYIDIDRDVYHEDNWEQGLLGMAFHPNFPATPYIYVIYTGVRDLRLGRLTADPANPNVVSRFTLVPMMIIQKPPLNDGTASPVHNGGDLAFGPDGLLYVPLGDGGPDPYVPEGAPGDPYNNSQRRDTVLGSILRINVDQNAGLKPDCGKELYSIPADNPFLGNGDCDEIWATGLRNPWRMSFDRLTGDLYVSDVGEWEYEEINFMPAGAGRGANYGWHCWEGTFNYLLKAPQFAPNCGPQETYVFPLVEYRHTDGDCSVTGGFVYRGSKYPALYGRYVYTDFCSGRIRTVWQDNMGRWNREVNGLQVTAISTFGEGSDGELYAGVYDVIDDGDPDVEVYRVVVRP